MATDFLWLLVIGTFLAIVFVILLYFMKVDPDAAMGASISSDRLPNETKVVHVQRPFELQIESLGDSSNRASLEDGLTVLIRSDYQFIVHKYWGVAARPFLELYNILFDTREIESQPRSNSYPPMANALEENSYLHQKLEMEYQNTENPISTRIQPPSDAIEYIMRMKASDLSHTTLFMPLVILLTFAPHNIKSDIVASAYFIVCEKKSDDKYVWSIWSEFLQTINTDVLRVQTLYDSGIIPDDIYGETISDGGGRGETICIICHNLFATRALLPCRHFCICAVCFHRVSQCPICRCSISSFLKLGDESQVNLTGFEEERSTTQNRIQNMSALELIRSIWNAS